MDRTTGRVLTWVVGIFSLAFFVLGIAVLARREDIVLGLLNLAIGIVWALGAILIRRHTPHQ